jgi:hypothetical protein
MTIIEFILQALKSGLATGTTDRKLLESNNRAFWFTVLPVDQYRRLSRPARRRMWRREKQVATQFVDLS